MKTKVSSEDHKVYNTPEKWFIREKWSEFALNRKKMNKRKFIRLFTLTSIKTYDIILFKETGLIETTETGYSENIAFCEKDSERFTMIFNALPGARAHLGTFEDFVGAGSIDSTNHAKEWFPFDVINLDFSGPMFKHRGRNTSKVMDAIKKVFMIQSFYRQSFSLFLSVPAIRKADDDVGKNQLRKCLDENLKNPQTKAFKETFI